MSGHGAGLGSDPGDEGGTNPRGLQVNQQGLVTERATGVGGWHFLPGSPGRKALPGLECRLVPGVRGRGERTEGVSQGPLGSDRVGRTGEGWAGGERGCRGLQGGPGGLRFSWKNRQHQIPLD